MLIVSCYSKLTVSFAIFRRIFVKCVKYIRNSPIFNAKIRYRMNNKLKQKLLIGIIGISPLFILSNATAQPVDFALPDLKGETQKLSDYRGKWVVVNYWATWCPPCLTEIPELIAFHEKHKDKDAVVIGVDLEDIGLAELNEFVESYFLNYPVLRKKPAAKSSLGIISGLPTSFLISPKGEVMAKQTGGITAKMIEDFIAGQKQAKSVVD